MKRKNKSVMQNSPAPPATRTTATQKLVVQISKLPGNNMLEKAGSYYNILNDELMLLRNWHLQALRDHLRPLLESSNVNAITEAASALRELHASFGLFPEAFAQLVHVTHKGNKKIDFEDEEVEDDL